MSHCTELSPLMKTHRHAADPLVELQIPLLHSKKLEHIKTKSKTSEIFGCILIVSFCFFSVCLWSSRLRQLALWVCLRTSSLTQGWEPGHILSLGTKTGVREGREGAGQRAWIGTRPWPLYIHQHIIGLVHAVRMHALTPTILSFFLPIFTFPSIIFKGSVNKKSPNMSFYIIK